MLMMAGPSCLTLNPVPVGVSTHIFQVNLRFTGGTPGKTRKPLALVGSFDIFYIWVIYVPKWGDHRIRGSRIRIVVIPYNCRTFLPLNVPT